MNRYSGHNRLFHLSVFVAPVISLALFTALYRNPEYVIGWSDLAVLWLVALLCSYGLIVVHELGHAAGGSLVGVPVRAIVIGTWRKLASFQIGRMNFTFRAAPGLGWVVPSKPVHGIPILRLAVFLLSGLAAEIVVLLLVLQLPTPESIDSFLAALVAFVPISVGWTVFVHVLTNLPPKTDQGSGLSTTDGTWLYRYWRAHKDPAHLLFVQKHELNALATSDDIAEATKLGESLAQAHPEDFEVQMAVGRLLQEAGRIEEALIHLRKMLINKKLVPIQRAEVLDALACVPLYFSRQDLLAEADEWSREALACSPDAITLKGTRGSLLIDRGENAEGAALLLQVLKETDCQTDRAIASAFLAKACAVTGDHEGAREWLAQARAIVPSPRVVARIEKELTAATTKAAVAGQS